MTRFLVLYPHANFATNPTMVQLCREMAEQQLETTFLVGGDPNSGRSLVSERSTVHFESLPEGLWNARVPVPIHKQVVRTLLGRSGQASVNALYRRARQFDVVAGADPLGICLAHQLCDSSTPLVYISFELLLSYEVVSDYEKQLKEREQAAIGQCQLFLLQDEVRSDAFCRDNAVAPKSVALVPVAPADVSPVKGPYLHEQLQIPSDKRIVLYQGSLYDWSCRGEFEELVSYWDDQFCLVIHSRDVPDTRMKRFLQSLQATGKIYHTSAPVAPDVLPELTASADVGLASYRTSPDHWLTGDNLRFLGLASGKIAYYTMCGLPVLARYLPTTAELLERHKCGLSYRRMSEAGELLRLIDRDLANFSRNSRSFYLNELEPTARIQTFIKRMKALA